MNGKFNENNFPKFDNYQVKTEECNNAMLSRVRGPGSATRRGDGSRRQETLDWSGEMSGWVFSGGQQSSQVSRWPVEWRDSRLCQARSVPTHLISSISCYLISHHTYHISFSYLIFALQMTVTRPSWRTSVTGGGRCTGGCSTGGRYTGTTVTSHSPCWAASWPGVTREAGDTEGRTGHLSVPVSIQCYICPVCQSSVM